MNSFRLLAKAIVIGAVAVVFGPAHVTQAGIDVWTTHGPYVPSSVQLPVSVRALAIDPITPSTLYAGTDNGSVFKSTDSGASWSAVNTGLVNAGRVFALAIDPTTPSTLYAGTWGGGVFQSTNGGASWNSVNTGLSNFGVSALAIDPSTPSTLYAGTDASNSDVVVFESTNGGGDWSSGGLAVIMPHGWFGSVHALAIDPSTPSTLYAGTNEGGVFQSTSGGGSWSMVNTGLINHSVRPVRALAIDPSTPSTLYAGTYGGGVFQSINSGGSWSAANTGLSNLQITALAIDPITPSTLYAGTLQTCDSNGSNCTGGGVFQSTNSGGSWSAVNTGLSGDALSVYALAIDPATPSTLYAGTVGGVFDIELLSGGPCVGDCDGSGEVTVNELITLVNIDLGTADASACPNGIPGGFSVDITLIIQAVNNALTNCPAP